MAEQDQNTKTYVGQRDEMLCSDCGKRFRSYEMRYHEPTEGFVCPECWDYGSYRVWGWEGPQGVGVRRAE